MKTDIEVLVREENRDHGIIWGILNYKVFIFLLFLPSALGAFIYTPDYFLEAWVKTTAMVMGGGFLNLFIPVLILSLFKKRNFPVLICVLVALVGFFMNAALRAFIDVSGGDVIGVITMYSFTFFAYKIMRSKYGLYSIGMGMKNKSEDTSIQKTKEYAEKTAIKDDYLNNIPLLHNNDLNAKSITLHTKYFHFLPVLNLILIILFAFYFYVDCENKFSRKRDEIEDIKKELTNFTNKENEKIKNELSDIKWELNDFIRKSEKRSSEINDRLDKLKNSLEDLETEMLDNMSPQDRSKILELREFKKNLGDIREKSRII